MRARGSEIKRFLDSDLRLVLAPGREDVGKHDISWEDADAKVENEDLLLDDVEYDLRLFGVFTWRGYVRVPGLLRVDLPFAKAYGLWREHELKHTAQSAP
jgi:hypothetical protein